MCVITCWAAAAFTVKGPITPSSAFCTELWWVFSVTSHHHLSFPGCHLHVWPNRGVGAAHCARQTVALLLQAAFLPRGSWWLHGKSNVLPQIASLSLLAVNFLPVWASADKCWREGIPFPFLGADCKAYPFLLLCASPFPPQAKKRRKKHLNSLCLLTIFVHVIAE